MSARIQSMFARIAGTILLLGSAALIPVTAAAQHFPSEEDVSVMLRYLVEDGETPAIVLGFIEADGSTSVVSYGDGGPDTRQIGAQSAFEIGSITKTFTAALLADMVERGEMSLTDPVSQYLPEGVTMPSRGGREITLHDLSTHHSGLPRLPDNLAPADRANPYADYSAEQLYDFLSNHELRRDPGSEFEYSNVGVGLLGHVLEQATGMTYEELVRERILEPLGMKTTGIALQGNLAEWMTKGHNDAGEPVPYWDLVTLAGAGGLRSNVEDMLKYVAANIRPPESDVERALHATHEIQEQVEEGAAIGLNWLVRSDGDRQLYTHGGGTAGFSTMVGFDPEKRVGVVMLTNTGDFDDDVGADFLRRGPPLAIPEVDVDPEILQTYVGQYEIAPDSHLVIRMEDDEKMTLQAPRNVRFRLYAESDTKFFVKRTPWRVTFTTDATGNVDGVMGDFEGDEWTGRKVSDETPPPAVVAGNATQR